MDQAAPLNQHPPALTSEQVKQFCETVARGCQQRIAPLSMQLSHRSSAGNQRQEPWGQSLDGC